MKSLQGHLLVASPHFVGSPVPRAVVLVTEHNEDHAAGVVLNHPLNEQILRKCLEMWQAGTPPTVALKMMQPQIPGLESLMRAMGADGDHALRDAENRCKKVEHCGERNKEPDHGADELLADLVEEGLSAEEVELPSPEGATGKLAAQPEAMQIPIGVLMAPNGFVGGRLSPKKPPLFRVVVGQVGWKNDVLDAELSQGHWLTVPATPDLLFAAHDDLWQFAVRRVGQGVLQNALGISSDVAPGLN